MNDLAENCFRTKTGTCTITPTQILLSREGVRGAAANQIVGGSIIRVLLIYGVLGCSMLAIGVWAFSQNRHVEGILSSLGGMFLLWIVARSRHNSAAPVIERAAIGSVEAHPPRPPQTRGYFVVHFEEAGTQRQRLIPLPGSWNNGAEEYQRAVGIMQSAGLLGEGA